MKNRYREKYINTHIEILDKLLGKNSVPPGHGVIEEGSIVIIRGEPGCGKTTLGLQVMSQYLKEHPKAWGCYFSLEKPPELVVNKMNMDFGMFAETKNRLSMISAEHIQELLRYIAMPRIRLPEEMAFELALDKSLGVLASVAGTTDFKKASVTALIELVRYWKNFLKINMHATKKVLFHKSIKATTRKGLASSDTNLFLIDSLNALSRLISVSLPGIDERVLLSIFLDSLKRVFNRIVLFATSEAARGTPYGSDSMSESYLCDVQILLRTEPVTVAANYMGEHACPVGYSIAKIREDLDKGRNQVETRPFCRVVKSRDCAHECRRVSFEFRESEGLRFNQTYPGDGRIMIFADNDAQESWWNGFIGRDLPNSYPALRYEIFNRPNLQMVYDGRRRLNTMSLKTDLFISAFDSYWLRWYCDCKIRDELFIIMESVFSNEKDETKKAQIINCSMHIARDLDKTLDPYYENSSSESDSYQRLIELVGIAKAGEIKSKVKHLQEKEEWTYIRPLPKKRLKKYGDRDSKFIEPIGDKCEIQKNAASTSETRLLSVPYDANVSFIVYRKDLLTGISKYLNNFEKPSHAMAPYHEKAEKFIALSKTSPGNQANIKSIIKEKLQSYVLESVRIISESFSVKPESGKKDCLSTNSSDIERLYKNSHSRSAEWTIDKFTTTINVHAVEENINGEKEKNIIDKAADRILKGDAPQTFEEVAFYFEMTGLQFIIDTRTFDSFLCFFWELIWNCGGDFLVHGDYSIDKSPANLAPSFLALYWFFWFFKNGMIVENSCTDPEEHAVEKGDWLFARHWYTTFIDLLTKKKKPTSNGSAKEFFVWDGIKKDASNNHAPYSHRADLRMKKDEIPDSTIKNDSSKPDIELEIMKFPVSMLFLAESEKRKAAAPNEEKEKIERRLHCSTLGEWHWAILSGSENEALGIEIINTLMTSQKIWERASKCAALPTVQNFYDDYGKMKCVPVPERKDIKLPTTTFGDIYNNLIKNSRTRNGIYDYRHCARVIHALLVNTASTVTQTHTDEVKAFSEIMRDYIKCLSTIESFYSKLNV